MEILITHTKNQWFIKLDVSADFLAILNSNKNSREKDK